MAIIIDGRSKCNICGNVMYSFEDLIAFPRFTIDENDSLYFFYDRIFHEKCFLSCSQFKPLIILLLNKGYYNEFEKYKDLIQ
jgi:hypothetical protein